ncbi:tetraacyldisaccharide 4'-kinase [Rubricella aquisinus]|uniref:Tetraacyldisaccharide 4'-kinase n=1 Tax=Rubricella aquisinus TaxID=2028108 RepID=A0A840X2A6_9RHOB|nr:tetraacyldisaccharide 4'-kinase [Rubricella aquisinus]MBB5516944.1 tetraacyldisaccharide 4'-kinase [Rubricella aquisinus]
MRAPAFWSRKPRLRATLLAPLGALYAFGTARRIARATPVKVDVPVISVGNISAGGTGKTPVVIALIERLTARGLSPHVISRGYGGTQIAPHRVMPDDAAERVGDEPLLLSAFAPVWVARDRAAGAQKAVAAGADCLILDDAHQNPGLAKDLSIVVIDAGVGFGNGRVIPAGPLREPIQKGLARADHVILIGTAQAQAACRARYPMLADLAQSAGALKPLAMGMPWQGLRVMAFAGIGRPEKFFQSLHDVGADICATRAFGDHAAFTPQILSRLEAEAKSLNAQLVTTEKDAVRLPMPMRRRVLTFPVRLEIADWSALDAALPGAHT